MLDTGYGDPVDWAILARPFFEFEPQVKWWYVWQITNQWQSYNSISFVDIGCGLGTSWNGVVFATASRAGMIQGPLGFLIKQHRSGVIATGRGVHYLPFSPGSSLAPLRLLLLHVAISQIERKKTNAIKATIPGDDSILGLWLWELFLSGRRPFYPPTAGLGYIWPEFQVRGLE